MKKHLPKILLFSLLLILSLVACQSAGTEEGPDNAYLGYYEACQDSKYETAAIYLDDQTKTQIESIGVCGFTHDAINRYEVVRGGTERTFTEDPVLEVNENNAVMTWVDDQGKIAIVQFVKTGDGWKIAQTVWSD